MGLSDKEEDLLDEVGNGLYCFLDPTRGCGPDCMAYIEAPNTPNRELSHQQQNCVLLSSIERGARHLTILASTLAESATKKRTAAADKQRTDTATTRVPGPFASSPFPAKDD